MTPKIESFSGEHHFLSNFHPAKVEYDGLWYSSVEHAYQAAKWPVEDRKHFRDNITPAAAKSLGKQAPLVADWDNRKVPIMMELVLKKFRNNQPLKEKLLATGDAELVEGNYWGDKFWGVCGGSGKNMLGRILMMVRETLINEQRLDYFFTDESPVAD